MTIYTDGKTWAETVTNCGSYSVMWQGKFYLYDGCPFLSYVHNNY